MTTETPTTAPALARFMTAAAKLPGVVLALVALVIVAGWLAFAGLPRDVFPNLSAPVFSIIVQNAALSADELETTVAVKLEAALAGLPNLRRVRSTSTLGVATVVVELDADADFQRSRQLVTERLAAVQGELPRGTAPPLLSSLSGRLNEIMELTLTAEPGTLDLMTLRDLAELELRTRFTAVPGVAAVERLGGHLRQVQVQLEPERMAARGVSLGQVRHALADAGENSAAGVLTEHAQESSIRLIARAETAAELGATVVAVRGTTPVLLRDVADVRDAPAFRRGVAHVLAGEVVSLRIVKQSGADTTAVAAGVRAALAELAPTLPAGATLRVDYDQSELVEGALGGVGRAVVIGAGFVIAVLFLLLGNLRAALLVTITIPLSLLVAAFFLAPTGVGLNTMTLGGLAIAVGLLVDAAIIVVENVLHRMHGAPTPAARRAQAIAAAAEVGRPIFFATLIVIVVFLPLGFMSGIEGKLYGPLALAVICAMGASLLLALTLVPILAATLLRPPRATAHGDVWLVRQLKRAYAPLLDACMRHAWLVRVLALALTVPTAWLAASLGSDFMPELDEGAILINTSVPLEASLEEVDLLNHQVEDVLKTFPEVREVVRRTGRSEHTEDPMPHVLSDVLVVLDPARERSIAELSDAMRDAIAPIPGIQAAFTTPLGMRIDEGLGGSPADLTVKIFGPDLAILAQYAERAQALMARVEGLVDLRADQIEDLPQVRITVDRAHAAQVGLTPGDIVADVRMGLVGEVMAPMVRGHQSFDVLLALQDGHARDLSALAALMLEAHDGTRIPLGAVATLERSVGPATLKRESGARRVAIDASVSGRDLGGAAAELHALLNAELGLPQGYFVAIGGRIETQGEAAKSLWMAILLAIVGVFVLLQLALRSFADALVILLSLPDAMVGGVLALAIAGQSWNVSSLVGLIGLFGIAVQNGLVLVSQTRALAAEGRPFAQALREACIGRVRPKIMTALTAMLGLLPLIVLDFHGTEIERPLAIVMVGGLITSTLFTLLALPTFYTLVERIRLRAGASSQARPSRLHSEP